MNIAKGAAFATVGLLAGFGLIVGVQQIGHWYAVLRQGTTMAANQPVQSPPPASTVTRPSAAPSASATQPVAFETLPACEQVDAIAKSGKSVAEFLVAAHRVGDLAKYKTAIGSTCPWNNEQLTVADRLINPPAVVVRSKAVAPTGVEQSSRTGSNSGDRTVVIREQPAPVRNNCNGIQEPGESHSASCQAAQRYNDETIRQGTYRAWDERDNRDPALQPHRVPGGTFTPDYTPGYSAR